METVYGNLQGIKAIHLKQLQRLYDQRLASDRFVSAEFAAQLATLSHDIHHPICCYINRRGQIVRVGVGTLIQTQLSESDLPRQSSDRLSGIYCLAVQPQAPDPASFMAMVRQRLDALVVLNPSEKKNRAGEIHSAYLAHITPDFDRPWEVELLRLEQLLELDVDDLLHDWEKELREAGVNLTELLPSASDQDRVLLVGLLTDNMSDRQFEEGLMELEKLVESAGGEVVGIVRQKRSQPHPQTVVGQGKVEEIASEVQTAGANLVVFDRDISASQIRNLEEQIGVRVVDRTEVILDIFAQRAQSQAGKLQVELAQLEYQLPRLRGRGQSMSRLGAGIGTRGPGETKLETERRVIQRRINQLQQEVNQLQAHRSRLRQQRQASIPVVAIIGYTNAGKSTLLNALTQADVYAADQLFATLDPTTRRLSIADQDAQSRREILLTDTVGFIHHLPPALVDAFRATLEEVTEADALLHLVDLSHPAWKDQIQSVEEILADLPEIPSTVLLVFNKIDRVDSDTLAQPQAEYQDALFISATDRLGLETLKQQLLALTQVAIACPP